MSLGFGSNWMVQIVMETSSMQRHRRIGRPEVLAGICALVGSLTTGHFSDWVGHRLTAALVGSLTTPSLRASSQLASSLRRTWPTRAGFGRSAGELAGCARCMRDRAHRLPLRRGRPTTRWSTTGRAGEQRRARGSGGWRVRRRRPYRRSTSGERDGTSHQSPTHITLR
jgi:hypothetical protein